MALTLTNWIGDGATFPSLRPVFPLVTSGATSGAVLNVSHQWATNSAFTAGLITVDDFGISQGTSSKAPTSDLTYGTWYYRGKGRELNTQEVVIGYNPIGSANRNTSLAQNFLDGDNGTEWNGAANHVVGDWIKADWGTGIQVDEIKALTSNSVGFPSAVDIEGSNDDSSWTPILTGQTYVGNGTWNDWTFTAATYRYWRLKVSTVGSSNWWRCNEFQFYYTSTQITEGATAGTWTLSDGISTTNNLQWNDTAATLKTRLETDIAAFTTVTVTGTGVTSDPFVITVNDPATQVPTYTLDASSLTPASGSVTTTVTGTTGEVTEVQSVYLGTAGTPVTPTGSASNGGGSIGNALDGVVDTLQFSTGTGQYSGMYAQFDFGSAVGLSNFRQYCTQGSYYNTDYPRNWKIRYSDDGSAWTDDATDSATAAGILDTPVTEKSPHRYWRIELTSGVGNWWRVNEFEFTFFDSPTSGTWTLSDGTDTTNNIQYNDNAATVETRLETDIASITNVTVTGSGSQGDPFIITFVDPDSAAYPYPAIDQLTGDFSSLNPAGGTVSTTSDGGPDAGEIVGSTISITTVDPKTQDGFLYSIVNTGVRTDYYLSRDEDGFLYTVANIGAGSPSPMDEDSFLYTIVVAQYELSHTVDAIIVPSLQTLPGQNIPEIPEGIVGFDPPLPLELSMSTSGLGLFAIVKPGYGAYPIPYPLGVDNTNVELGLEMTTVVGQSTFFAYPAITSTNMDGVGNLSLTITNYVPFSEGITFAGVGNLNATPYSTSQIDLGPVTFAGVGSMRGWGFFNPIEVARFLYLYVSVGVAFDPTDAYTGSGNVVSEPFPDGATIDFDRWLYQYVNVGVGFDPTDDASGKPGFAATQTYPDGATIDFDRWLYQLVNVVDWIKNPGRGRLGLAPRLPTSLHRATPPQLGHP